MTKAAAPERRDERRWRKLAGGLLALAAVVLLGWLVVRRPNDVALPHEELGAVGEGGAAVPGGSAPPPPPRCELASPKASYRVGKSSAPAKPAGERDEDELEPLDEPFAAIVGRAAALGDGWVAGVRQDAPDGARTGVVLLDRLADDGSTVDLGRSRGDVDAPIVTAHAGKWLAALLEPDAGGYSMRLVSAGTSEPAWGVAVEQRRDESLALDVAAGERVAVAAWDELTKDGKRSEVRWGAFSLDGKAAVRKPQAASGRGVDADTPRVIPRPGGFWLAYVARTALKVPDDDSDEALGRSPDEERYAAEKIDPSWLELMPLDERGAATGPATRVTPPKGHVLAYDLALGKDGGALLAWRDDDTPSGAFGGRLEVMLVTPSGAMSTQIAAQEDVGAGAPSLLPGWLAYPDARGRLLLAPLGDDGVLQGDARHEPTIGLGQPLAARDDHLLIATAAGTAVDLTVVRCRP